MPLSFKLIITSGLLLHESHEACWRERHVTALSTTEMLTNRIEQRRSGERDNENKLMRSRERVKDTLCGVWMNGRQRREVAVSWLERISPKKHFIALVIEAIGFVFVLRASVDETRMNDDGGRYDQPE